MGKYSAPNYGSKLGIVSMVEFREATNTYDPNARLCNRSCAYPEIPPQRRAIQLTCVALLTEEWLVFTKAPSCIDILGNTGCRGHIDSCVPSQGRDK